ncbi:hypothetical protein Tco_1378901 [Tanacetum coccineum]
MSLHLLSYGPPHALRKRFICHLWHAPTPKPDVPGYESRVHTHDHDGSEAPDRSPDSILSSKPKPLGKPKPPPLPSILSPRESSYPPKSNNRPTASPYQLAVIYETYYPKHPLARHASPVYHAHRAQQAL